MRFARLGLAGILAAGATFVAAGQAPPPQQPPPTAPGQRGAAPAPGGRGGGRGGVQVMTLTAAGWADGGTIPMKHSQGGGQISPALSWSNVPDGIVSFVLIVHDADAAMGNGTDDVLHWMLWNIPGTARGLPEGVAQGTQLADGSRQISATGPFYRGPGAAAAGPAHHYTFEIFALDTTLDVPAVGASPPQTRAAVVAAMAGHVRGKGVTVGLFKRG